MRIDAIDMARGYTVLLMPLIHAMVMYAGVDAHFTTTATVISWFGEETGAPLFMLLMGLSAGLTKKATAFYFLKRSIVLLCLAFLLNLLKFVLPYVSGTMPHDLLIDLGMATKERTALNLLLIGDIFHLAALSFMTFALCRLAGNKERFFEYLLPVLVFLISERPFYNNSFLTAWLTGTVPNVYFPLLPWLFYPLLGKLLSGVIETEDGAFWKLAVMGAGWVMAALFIFGFTPHESLFRFYKPGQGALLYYSGCSLMWLFVCDRFSKACCLTHVKEWLRFLSRHITLFYLIQWVLVCWAMAVVGYRQQSLINTLLLATIITALTVWLTVAFVKLKR